MIGSIGAESRYSTCLLYTSFSLLSGKVIITFSLCPFNFALGSFLSFLAELMQKHKGIIFEIKKMCIRDRHITDSYAERRTIL